MTILRMLPTTRLPTSVLAIGISTIAMSSPNAKGSDDSGAPVAGTRIDHAAMAIPAVTVIAKRSDHEQKRADEYGRRVKIRRGDGPKDRQPQRLQRSRLLLHVQSSGNVG